MRRQTSRHSVVHKPPRQIRFTFFPSGFALKALFPERSSWINYQRISTSAKSGSAVSGQKIRPRRFPLREQSAALRNKNQTEKLFRPIIHTCPPYGYSLTLRWTHAYPIKRHLPHSGFSAAADDQLFRPPLFKTKFITFFASFYTAARRLHVKQLYFESFTAAFTIFLKFISPQAMTPYKVRHGQRLFCGCIFAIAV